MKAAANFSSRGWFCCWLGVASVVSSGCAIKHYDASTGTEHLWGFGHLKMKAAPSAGIVKTRTDGQRLLVYTNSGQAQLKGAYALRHDPKTGEIVPNEIRKI